MAAPAAVAGSSGLRLRPRATAEPLSSPPTTSSRAVLLSSELSRTFLRPAPLSLNRQASRTFSPPLPSSSTSRNQFLAFGESRFQCGITHRQRVSCHSSRSSSSSSSSSSSNTGSSSRSDRETGRHRERLLPPCAAVAGGTAAEEAPGSDTTTGSSSSNGKPEEPSRGSSLNKVQVAAGAAAVLLLTTVGAAAVLGGGPAGLVSSLSKSGFTAAFSLIFVSEIGDKTFFIAALLAMRYSKSIVLAGAVTALGAMSVISVIIGRLFRELPSQLKTSIPIGEYLACALLVWFGVTSIVQALKLPQAPAPALAASNGGATTSAQSSASDEEEGELAEAREYVDKAVAEHNVTTPFAAFWETLTLIFVAEWGDRSMLATIALGAAQSPVGVALGATWGHFVATSIAVVSGAFLSQYISERVVGLVGGVLFLLFAAATLFGIF